jgi:hypothetical protein
MSLEDIAGPENGRAGINEDHRELKFDPIALRGRGHPLYFLSRVCCGNRFVFEFKPSPVEAESEIQAARIFRRHPLPAQAAGPTHYLRSFLIQILIALIARNLACGVRA